MKTKSKITALLLAALMLVAQVPFAAFAEETTDTDTTTDIRADLLSPDTLPDGRVEVKYTKQFYFNYSQFNKGFMAYSWSIPDDEIPPGLELGGQYSTWQPTLMGTPTKEGTYTFTIEGARTDYENGQSVRTIAARKTYTMTILPAYPLEIRTKNLYSGSEESSYSNTINEYKNRAVTWSMTLENGGALPEGLSIDAETGKISWASPVKGKYNLKITAARGEESVSKVLKLIIEPGNGCTHEAAEKTERKKATCKENGMADYWYCDTCEGYFLDEECTRRTSSDSLDKLYTVGFHSDKIGDDGKCDTCGRIMPIFKKVTSKDEITSCGMYLVVSEINGKYYTFKAPQESDMNSIEAVEITPNADGTFSYPKADADVMILKTEFAANCGDLDALGRRYSFGTTIDNIPYGFQTQESSIQLASYRNSKYGYIINLTDEQYAEIASVYSAYWSENGWDGRYILSAVAEETEDGADDVSFCFTEPEETTRSPISLYKLTYTEKLGENGSYTLDDAHSKVTINNDFTIFDIFASKGLSTAGGLSEAVKPSYVKGVISNNNITGNVSVRTYAKIELTGGTTTTNEKYNYTDINSVCYSVTPMLEITDAASQSLYSGEIGDENFDGSEMTVSLCVGSMSNPKQIIHHKTDGTKEYFYNENNEGLQAGQKTFSLDEGSYINDGTTGHFVTFTIDSFSDIEILDTAVAEEHGTKTTVSEKGGKLTVLGNNIDGCTVILALYKTDSNGNSRLVECQTAQYSGSEKTFTTTADYTTARVMVWKSLKNSEPVTTAENVNLE